jgi:hypothetical protein
MEAFCYFKYIASCLHDRAELATGGAPEDGSRTTPSRLYDKSLLAASSRASPKTIFTINRLYDVDLENLAGASLDTLESIEARNGSQMVICRHLGDELTISTS